MRTVEDIARILVKTLSKSDSNFNAFGSGWIDSKTFGLDEVVIDGHYNIIELVKKLQALGIIESSETE